MVLTLPEVSKCIINSSLDDASIDSTIKKTIEKNTSKNNLSHLSHLLQLSLDTEKILQLFFKQIKHDFKLSKLLYTNNQGNQNINILLGNKITPVKFNIKNVKKYELFHQQEYLGELDLISQVKLNPAKTIELKSYINLLILPLRNSLLYTKALKDTRIDPLTQTGNRLALFEDLNYHFNFSTRYNTPLSIIFIDIDFFKQINDQYGHILGDKILINLSQSLKNIIRKSDMVYRFGGEEFVILLENTNQNGVLNLAKKFKAFFNTNKIHDLNVTISMGIATRDSTDSIESLIDRADRALYKAKAKGRNKFVVG